VLDLMHQVGTEIADVAGRPVHGRIRCDRQQSIVPLLLPLLGLFRFDHADQARRHDAARIGRRVHQQEHVQRIAVIAERRRDHPEIEGEYGSDGQHPLEHECAVAWFVRKLVLGAFGRFDDHDQLVTVERGKAVERWRRIDSDRGHRLHRVSAWGL
jgi:hypothetical protein